MHMHIHMHVRVQACVRVGGRVGVQGGRAGAACLVQVERLLDFSLLVGLTGLGLAVLTLRDIGWHGCFLPSLQPLAELRDVTGSCLVLLLYIPAPPSLQKGQHYLVPTLPCANTTLC